VPKILQDTRLGGLLGHLEDERNPAVKPLVIRGHVDGLKPAAKTGAHLVMDRVMTWRASIERVASREKWNGAHSRENKGCLSEHRGAMLKVAACLSLVASVATGSAGTGSAATRSAARGVAPPAASPQTCTLIAKVVGLRNTKGKVDVLLFRSSAGFPDEPSQAVVDDEHIDPKTLTAQIVFQHVTPGPAAVTVLHDENLNDKLDTNLVGIPREGYGASNNPKKRLRAPTFAEARFSVSRPRETIRIRVMYW
jgi:uncharacterized protein (DUF2141 family)